MEKYLCYATIKEVLFEYCHSIKWNKPEGT